MSWCATVTLHITLTSAHTIFSAHRSGHTTDRVVRSRKGRDNHICKKNFLPTCYIVLTCKLTCKTHIRVPPHPTPTHTHTVTTSLALFLLEMCEVLTSGDFVAAPHVDVRLASLSSRPGLGATFSMATVQYAPHRRHLRQRRPFLQGSP